MPRPHKILLMSGSMDGGGSERQVLYLLKHLDRERFAPHLFLSYQRGELLDEIPDDVTVTAFWDKYEQPAVKVPGRVHRAQVRFVRELMLREKFALLYDRTFHMSLIARPAVRGLRVGRVAAIVSPPDQDLPGTEHRFVAIKKWLLRRSYSSADRIVTVSNAVAECASKFYGIQRADFTTIHSPIDIEALDSSASPLPEQSIDPVDVNIACIGRMTKEKGHHMMLEAIGAIKEHPVFDCLKVWMVGDGPLRSELEALANNLGLSERVHFTGKLPSAAPVLSRCQLVCCPSKYEGLPNVVLEAMALGVPVIASNVGGTSELLGQQEFGTLIPPGNAGILSSAITSFAEHHEHAQDKAIKAKEQIRSLWSIPAVMPKIESLLLDVLE